MLEFFDVWKRMPWSRIFESCVASVEFTHEAFETRPAPCGGNEQRDHSARPVRFVSAGVT